MAVVKLELEFLDKGFWNFIPLISCLVFVRYVLYIGIQNIGLCLTRNGTLCHWKIYCYAFLYEWMEMWTREKNNKFSLLPVYLIMVYETLGNIFFSFTCCFSRTKRLRFNDYMNFSLFWLLDHGLKIFHLPQKALWIYAILIYLLQS